MSALNSSEPTTFLIECPKCHLMASGEMVFAEPSKHYREVVLTAYPSRIVCDRCGFAREYVSPAETIDWDSAERSRYFDYTLWLRTEFDGHQLWARNLSHLLALEAYLKKPMRTEFPDSTWIEVLPRWLICRKNRERVLRKIAILKRRVMD